MARCSYDLPGRMPGSRKICWDEAEGAIDGNPACDAHLRSAEREHTGKLSYLDSDEDWADARRMPLSRTVVRWDKKGSK